VSSQTDFEKMFKLLIILTIANAANLDPTGVVQRVNLLTPDELKAGKKLVLPKILSPYPINIMIYGEEGTLGKVAYADFVQDCIGAADRYQSVGHTVNFVTLPPNRFSYARNTHETFTCVFRVVPCSLCVGYDGRVTRVEFPQ
jgi:hypothetical protein